MVGMGNLGWPRSNDLTSVPQVSAARTRRTISPGPGTGRGIWQRDIRPGSQSTNPCIAGALLAGKLTDELGDMLHGVSAPEVDVNRQSIRTGGLTSAAYKAIAGACPGTARGARR